MPGSKVYLYINNGIDTPFIKQVWREPDSTSPVLYRNKECTTPYVIGELLTWGYYNDWRGELTFARFDYVANSYLI